MKGNLAKLPPVTIQQPNNVTRSEPSTPVSSFPDFSLNTNGTNVKGQDEMGPSVSMAVHADDEASFQKSTFNLKRTQSVGLLDEYIDPTRTLLGRTGNTVGQHANYYNYASMSVPTICLRQIDEDKDEDQMATDVNEEDSEESTDEKVAFDQERVFSGEEDSSGPAESENSGEEPSRSVSVSPPPADNDDLLLPQDDNDLMREPERHVDYLSHEWNESDISNSWKYIILKKKKKSSVDQVNAARLENASWRTWAKARNHLEMVSPEIVNWSKDSDVTWLYGPIVRENDDEDKDPELGYGSDDETSKRMSKVRGRKKDFHGPKPILKKRTVQEILQDNSLWKLSEARKHRLSSSSAVDASSCVHYPADDYDDYDALAAKVNAQYYGPENSHSRADANNSVGHNSNVANHTTIAAVDSSETVPQAGNPLASSVGDSKGPNNGAMNDHGTGSKSRSNGDRHIHFNDRVEQCIAIADSNFDIDFIDSGLDQSGYDDIDSYGSASIMDDHGDETLAQVANISRATGDSDASYSEDEDADDEDNAGLFITPTVPRRSDSATHSPITDNSSTSSFKGSKLSLHPLIKLLPATTLNYGSDNEASDNSEYNGYGSSVSHNVNTYRGYDYIYDYNSVYTGDTSSFLPVESCDVVDVPDGIDLHSAIAGDNVSTYEFNHAAFSDLDRELQAEGEKQKVQEEGGLHQQSNPSLFYNESDDSGFDSDEQFIEDSHYSSSEAEDEEENEEQYEEDDDLSLKRVSSVGKTGSSNSLGDLQGLHPFNVVSPRLPAHSFISGKSVNGFSPSPVDSTNSNSSCNGSNDNTSSREVRTVNSDDYNDGGLDNEDATINHVEDSARRKGSNFPLKRIPSSSFIFNSESEDEDEGVAVKQETKDSLLNCKISQRDESPKLSLDSQSRVVPPRSSVVLPITVKSEIPPGSQLSDVSKSIRIRNSLSPAEVRASDVAISGSFSPVNDTIKSVVLNEGIIDKNAKNCDSGNDIHIEKNGDDLNKNLRNCHIDENISNVISEQRDSNESVQKMMQNAKEIANKYLHSWKRGDKNSQPSKADNKSARAD